MAPILGASTFAIWARIVSTTDLGADRLDFRDVPRPEAWDRRRRPQCCLTEPLPRPPAESLQRPADTDRGHDPPVGVDHRCADRRHTRLTLRNALRPSFGTCRTGQHLAGRSAIDRQQGTLGDDPAQTMGRLQRHHAAPAVALADEQLHTLTRLVPERREDGSGEIGEREGVGRGLAQGNELQTEAVPPVEVAAHKAMLLERRRQAMGGRSWQTSRGVELGECARSIGARGRASTATVLSTTPTLDTVSTGQELYLRM